jgi:hypothetical protein
MTAISNSEKCKRITKYILMGLVTTCALRYVPSTLLDNRELLMVSFIVSISFAMLDMISPSIVISETKTITKVEVPEMIQKKEESSNSSEEIEDPVDSTLHNINQKLDTEVESYDPIEHSASV